MAEDIFEELGLEKESKEKKKEKQEENSLEVLDKLSKELQQFKTIERKMEYLEKLLSKEHNQTKRRAIFTLMASLQAERKWFNSAAKSLSNAADLAETFREKIDLFLRAMLFYVKAQDYLEAEATMRKALVLAIPREKQEIQKSLVNAYLQQAKEFENNKQLTKAINVLSRVLVQKIDKELEREVKTKMAELYDRIGRPIEANRIRSEIK
ncbi:MAG: hypothetical protein NZ889_00480 [Candidatus Pacearchaeota archaeon]|nr:hypothetical protein [Candidatus Pacearchaeota archaeon]